MATLNTNVDLKKIKMNKDGIIPVVAQDYESGEVLMLVYMNGEALKKTFETGYAHYYSRSKKMVTKYGEAAGNTQKVMAAFLDHDADTLLLKVKQKGQALPEKNSFTCFPEQIVGEYNTIGAEMFGRLQRMINDCKKNPEEGSYASYLFIRGIDKIAKKVGEEAVELVIAAKNPDKSEVVDEAADFLYHMMVLLAAKGVNISEVGAELCKRNR
jgi:phosphoribosyl-ATP pyrophosphohydrolase/phosphoribosyl-AMP cyclohydrolase